MYCLLLNPTSKRMSEWHSQMPKSDEYAIFTPFQCKLCCNNEIKRLLPCNHAFCGPCTERVQGLSGRCPTCAAPFNIFSEIHSLQLIQSLKSNFLGLNRSSPQYSSEIGVESGVETNELSWSSDDGSDFESQLDQILAKAERYLIRLNGQSMILTVKGAETFVQAINGSMPLINADKSPQLSDVASQASEAISGFPEASISSFQAQKSLDDSQNAKILDRSSLVEVSRAPSPAGSFGCVFENFGDLKVDFRRKEKLQQQENVRSLSEFDLKAGKQLEQLLNGRIKRRGGASTFNAVFNDVVVYKTHGGTQLGIKLHNKQTLKLHTEIIDIQQQEISGALQIDDYEYSETQYMYNQVQIEIIKAFWVKNDISNWLNEQGQLIQQQTELERQAENKRINTHQLTKQRTRLLTMPGKLIATIFRGIAGVFGFKARKSIIQNIQSESHVENITNSPEANQNDLEHHPSLCLNATQLNVLNILATQPVNCSILRIPKTKDFPVGCWGILVDGESGLRPAGNQTGLVGKSLRILRRDELENLGFQTQNGIFPYSNTQNKYFNIFWKEGNSVFAYNGKIYIFKLNELPNELEANTYDQNVSDSVADDNFTQTSVSSEQNDHKSIQDVLKSQQTISSIQVDFQRLLKWGGREVNVYVLQCNRGIVRDLRRLKFKQRRTKYSNLITCNESFIYNKEFYAKYNISFTAIQKSFQTTFSGIPVTSGNLKHPTIVTPGPDWHDILDLTSRFSKLGIAIPSGQDGIVYVMWLSNIEEELLSLLKYIPALQELKDQILSGQEANLQGLPWELLKGPYNFIPYKASNTRLFCLAFYDFLVTQENFQAYRLVGPSRYANGGFIAGITLAMADSWALIAWAGAGIGRHRIGTASELVYLDFA